ncbi:MAG: serine/threonine-protein kinase [Acidobacteriota bacterium]
MLDGTERRAFLESQRVDGADVIDQVEAMLEANRQASSEIGGIVDSAVVNALQKLPDRIGPYEIVSQIGAGGFCSVYRARLPEEATQEATQNVAIKVLKRGLTSRDAERRLQQESEILARLHHPNIARLLGHRTSHLGEPYFVLELIDGEPIDRFCDNHRWTIDQRLKLFCQVCSAVDYAHANLVIHRDIKPNNLLVTPDGTPKLLDFGIAKLLLPELSRADPVHTLAGNSWMTPDYASPEQVREEPLTTATDVYSLGVLLYRLLCGRPPYQFHSRSPRAIEDVISNAEPPAPSSHFAGLPSNRERHGEASARDLARCRGTTAPQLRDRLRGDLDSIVLMALSKQADRRYASALQLSQDIERHLRSEPVSARRLTPFYLARKFVRRHAISVGVAVAILATSAAAVVVTTRATLHAEAERSRAERHLAESQQVAELLVEIFEVPDPKIVREGRVTAEEVLDEGARRIATQLQHQPELRASLMAIMGRVYRNLGNNRKSRELLDEALAHRRELHGDADLPVIETQQELARSLLAQGEYEAANELLRTTQSSLQAAGRDETAPYALTLTLLAGARKQMNQLDEAENLAQQALELQRVLLDPADPALIESMSLLAEVLSLKRDFDAAEAKFRETLELRRAHLGDNHPDVATNLGDLTVVLHGQGRFEEAEQAVRETIRIRANLYGDDHWIVGTSYHNLGQLLAAKGQVDEALPWLERSLEISRAQLGQDHPKIAGSLVSLAMLNQRLDRFQEAEALYLRALELHREKLGEQHPSTARNLYQIATLHAAQGRHQKALPLLDRVVATFRASMPHDYRLSHPLLLRGRIFIELGNCAQALPDLRQALELRQNELPEGHESLEEITAELDLCGDSRA